MEKIIIIFFLAFYFICFLTNKCFYFLLGVFEASLQLHATTDEASPDLVSARANAKNVLRNTDVFQSDHKNPGFFFPEWCKNTHCVTDCGCVWAAGKPSRGPVGGGAATLAV